MNRRGVCYDVGAVTDMDWRPAFDPRIVRRQLENIRDDLHCNAVRITAGDFERLDLAARDALALGLEVWLHPVLWDKGPDATLAYMVRGRRPANRPLSASSFLMRTRSLPRINWSRLATLWRQARNYPRAKVCSSSARAVRGTTMT